MDNIFDLYYIKGWDWFSMFIYWGMAIWGCLCFGLGKREQLLHKNLSGQPFKNVYYWGWFSIWTFFAVYRYVAPGIGGMDTLNYIDFFQNCNNKIYSGWMLHAGDDLFFKYFNKVIRYLSADYHVYFVFLYGIMVWIMIAFIDYFCPKDKFTAVPALLIFHIYLRGYSSERSNLGFCLLLLAIIMMSMKEYKWMIGCLVASVLTHKSMVVFATFIPFYFFFNKYELNLKRTIILIILSSISIYTIRDYAIVFLGESEFEGAYDYYVSNAGKSGFFSNYWKIAFEQIVLGIVLLLFNTPLQEYIASSDEETASKIKLVWMLCLFDLILIPVCYILSIWRAPEYFHMARTVMWCIMFWILFDRYRINKLGNILLFLAFLAWIYNRVDHTWASTGLMPYILDVF